MAERNRKHHRHAQTEDHPSERYSAVGHPSVEQLMAEQGTEPIKDAATLHGGFWPEEESIDDFLAALNEWRGHKRTDPAA